MKTKITSSRQMHQNLLSEYIWLILAHILLCVSFQDVSAQKGNKDDIFIGKGGSLTGSEVITYGTIVCGYDIQTRLWLPGEFGDKGRFFYYSEQQALYSERAESLYRKKSRTSVSVARIVTAMRRKRYFSRLHESQNSVCISLSQSYGKQTATPGPEAVTGLPTVQFTPTARIAQ